MIVNFGNAAWLDDMQDLLCVVRCKFYIEKVPAGAEPAVSTIPDKLEGTREAPCGYKVIHAVYDACA